MSGLSRYAEIRQTLERAILTGAWPPGHRIPSEHDLVARYKCSRMTVNKALSGLAASGLITRRRRSGSFVAVPAAEKNVLQVYDIADEVRRDGKIYSYVLRGCTSRKANAADAARLNVKTGERVLAVTCVHAADGKPLVAEDRLINLAAVPGAAGADFHTQSPGGWLIAHIPWSQAEHHIRAVNASAEVARDLAIAKGAACLVIERRTLQAGQVITHVILHHPGDAYQLVARFNPASATS